MGATSKTKRVFDDWKFWMGVAYFGLVIAMVGLYVTFNKAQKEETLRVSQRVAAIQQCIASIPILIDANDFVEGVKLVHTALVKNSEANLHLAKLGTHTYSVRLQSLHRLERARNLVLKLHFPIPTVSSCNATAVR